MKKLFALVVFALTLAMTTMALAATYTLTITTDKTT